MGIKKKQPIGVLLELFFEHLHKLGRSQKTIITYDWRFRKLKSYMDLNGTLYYDQDVEHNYLYSVLGNFDYTLLSSAQKIFVNSARTLTEFQRTGTIQFGVTKQPPKVFSGQIGSTMVDFIAYREAIFHLSETTMINYTNYLYHFLAFLNKEPVVETSQLSETVIFRYVSSLNPDKVSQKDRTLQFTRNYLKYLYIRELTSKDYSCFIPKCNYTPRPKLPSTFTTSEISALLAAVDRGSPKGKRDYAILLLAIQLGLRSSDIRWLRFEHILWQQNIIKITQKKTGKVVILPLLPEVGNAIIEYLKHGRPVSQESHLFLQIISPYKHIDKCTIGTLVQCYLRKAGINCSNRKRGPHTLRHSLASTLLSKKTPLPVISQALGHSNIDSAKPYLRIDLESLRQCALKVPSVPKQFYRTSKGGLYHG